MSEQLFDHAVRDWLDDGSDRTPPAAIDAVLLAVKTTPQERDLRIPRRFTLTPTYMRLAAAVAAVAVLGVGALIYWGRDPGVGTPTPAPSPTIQPSASPAAGGPDTSDWVSYTSERYGFDIKRPPDWTETPSDHLFVLSDAATYPFPGTEDFYTPGSGDGQGVRVSAWSIAVEPGTSLGAWIEDYCDVQGSPCSGVLNTALSITMDGHRAESLAWPAEDSRVFALVNNRIYIVTVWRSDTDPAVAQFGGSRKLVEAYVSTMTLRPGGPAPVAAAPALTATFTSTRYGFSIDYPSNAWTTAPSTYLWVPTKDGPDGWSDKFLPLGVDPATATGSFRVASALVPDGITPDDAWIDQFLGNAPGECGPPRSTLGDIAIDGQTGKVRTSCEEVEATLVVGDRVYLFSLFLDAGGPYSTAGGKALFDAMIASVQLTPETAEVAPSPADS